MDAQEDARWAIAELGGPGRSIADAVGEVPAHPGLYAIHGSLDAWAELGLEHRDGPLYVGKSESSLASRDVRTHFATGKSGSSTVRRSVAALLATDLDLHAQPRNSKNPGHFANYSLGPEGDERLTEWMRRRLTLSFWVSPRNDFELAAVETEVIRHLAPPLNIQEIPAPSARLRAARRAMAQEARAFASVGRKVASHDRAYASLADALADHQIPVGNHAVVHTILSSVGVAALSDRNGFIKAARVQSGPDLQIHSGWTSGLTEEEARSLVGAGPIWPSDRDKGLWGIDHPVNSLRAGSSPGRPHRERLRSLPRLQHDAARLGCLLRVSRRRAQY